MIGLHHMFLGATENGIATGDGEQFTPNGNVDRQQLATMPMILGLHGHFGS